MAQSGILTTEMPAILGSDFCGIVDEVGSDCTKLQVGDHVFGLCRLGQNPYSPFQDKFLVDEDLAFKRPERLDAEVAASVGVGVLVCHFIAEFPPSFSSHSLIESRRLHTASL
jgi:NADPH:quinone reductase-like Zn-dependent oxidoreductase